MITVLFIRTDKLSCINIRVIIIIIIIIVIIIIIIIIQQENKRLKSAKTKGKNLQRTPQLFEVN